MRPLVVLVALSAATAGSGCRPRGPAPVCTMLVGEARALESETHELRAPSLLQELLEGFDVGTMLAPVELRDCRGRRVELAQEDCEPAPPLVERPPRPLGPSDLIVNERDGGGFLFWAQGRHFVDGTALGPVGYAAWNQRGFLVFSVGSLHGPAAHARLKREPLDEHELLIAEGDACPGDGEVCERIVRLVPLIDGEFIDAPMRLPGGGCAGPATFPLSQEDEVLLPSGHRRRFRLQRSVAVKGGDARVFEEAVATDFDPRIPGSPGAEHRRASKERRLRLDKDGLVIEAGIWDEIREIRGSVRPGGGG